MFSSMEFNVPILIKEAKNSYKNGNYISSLLLTFSLVDKCAAIYSQQTLCSFNKEHNSDCFINWIDHWERCDADTSEEHKEQMKRYEERMKEHEIPRLSGAVIYQIRCELTHKLTNINFYDLKSQNRIFKETGNEKLKHLRLYLDPSADIEMYISSYSSGIYNDEGVLDIDLSGLISKLLYLVKIYYDKNTELFNNNFQIEIIKKGV